MYIKTIQVLYLRHPPNLSPVEGHRSEEVPANRYCSRSQLEASILKHRLGMTRRVDFYLLCVYEGLAW